MRRCIKPKKWGIVIGILKKAVKRLKLNKGNKRPAHIHAPLSAPKSLNAYALLLLIAALTFLPATQVYATKSNSNTNQPEWAQQDNGSDISWQAATEYCQALGPNWRLPTPAELLSLFDPTESVRCGWNYCHTRRDFNLSGNWFWSNQSQTNNHALGVNLDIGRVDRQTKDPQGFGRALCVKTNDI